eukprot:SAG22_NODE_243_length_14055_cov_3.073015_14_plen_104_part_00
MLSLEIREFYQRKYAHEIAEFDVAQLLDELPSVLAAELEDYLYSKYWKIHSMAFWDVLLFDHLDVHATRRFCQLVRASVQASERSQASKRLAPNLAHLGHHDL